MNMIELSCGNCGCAEHRLRAAAQPHTEKYYDIATVCVGCGCVSHIVVTPARITIKWGRKEEGEKHDGVLCEMNWPAPKATS